MQAACLAGLASPLALGAPQGRPSAASRACRSHQVAPARLVVPLPPRASSSPRPLARAAARRPSPVPPRPLARQPAPVTPRRLQSVAHAERPGRGGGDLTQEEEEAADLYGIFAGVDFPGNKLVWVSAIFYVGMAGCSVVAGQFLGLPDLVPDLAPVAGWAVPTVTFMLPLLALLVWSMFFGDEFEDVRQLKEMYAETLVPALASASVLGIGVMAAGAGFGEEMAFRGVMQQWLGGQLGGGGGGAVAAIAATSLVFGAAHAVTPLYFLFATIAGAVFGIEYALLDGNLWAPSMTHFLYDWIALYALAKTDLFRVPEGRESS